MAMKLEKYQYHLVKNLLSDIDIQVVILGVINKEFKGEIWCDSVSDPRTALIIDNIWVMYLLGDPNNSKFNKEARYIIRDYIFPKKREDLEVDREWILVFYSDSWIPKFESELDLHDWFLTDIWHYKFEKIEYSNWRDDIPKGYSLKQVDEEFLTNISLKNHESITNWMYHRWNSIPDFFQNGFCFCLIKDDREIVGWAIADWATENYIVMGLDTDENYRMKGFAAIVSAAAAEYCTAKKKVLRWFCSPNNVGSWKTAEKVGFQKFGSHKIVVGELPIL